MFLSEKEMNMLIFGAVALSLYFIIRAIHVRSEMSAQDKKEHNVWLIFLIVFFTIVLVGTFFIQE